MPTPKPSDYGLDSQAQSLPLPFNTTASGSVLVPFTLNFTITNLHYMEEMNQLDSRIFNNTEKILQQLVRVALISFLPCPLHLCRQRQRDTTPSPLSSGM